MVGPLSSGQKIAMEVGRAATALCIIGDGIWYIVSRDTRIAYMRALGIPVQLVYLTAAVYLYCGFRLLLSYGVRATCTAMIITYALVTFLVHHPVGEGGIGEYPKNINGEVNFLNMLKYAAVIGGLFQITGYADFKKRGAIMDGTQSYGIVLGRAAIGIHYMIESFWFRLYQRDLRTKQIHLMGGDPTIHVWVVGSIYVIGGMSVWFGGAKIRKMAALLLAALTAVLTFMEGSSVATSLGIYHMTPHARLHHIIVNAQIIIGCLMIFIIGEQNSVGFAEKGQ